MYIDEVQEINKIYEINDYETAFLPKGNTVKDLINWYKGYCGEDLNIEEIKEVDYNKGFWSCDIPKEIRKKLQQNNDYTYAERDQFFLDKNGKVKEGTVEIINGDPYIYRLFSTEVKENKENEIYILCSTDF